MGESENPALIPRRLVTPNAKTLGEIALLQAELTSCIAELNLARDRFIAEPAQSDTVATALYRDSIVRFTACFGTGRHQLSSNKVYDGVPGAKGYFEFILNLRSSWVAHNHGPTRQSPVGVLIDDDGQILGVVTLTSELRDFPKCVDDQIGVLQPDEHSLPFPSHIEVPEPALDNPRGNGDYQGGGRSKPGRPCFGGHFFRSS